MDKNVKIVIFSKLDKIIFGGFNNKFDGCVFSVLVFFYWKMDLIKNISVNIIECFFKRDFRVYFIVVFFVVCFNFNLFIKGDYEI